MSKDESLRGRTPETDGRPKRASRWWYLLFVVQFAAIAWPPLYNRAEPAWGGIPFFYWYQMLWILISAVLTTIVYFATEHGRK